MRSKKLVTKALAVGCLIVSNSLAMKMDIPEDCSKTEYKVHDVSVTHLHFASIDSTQTWSIQNVDMSYPEDTKSCVIVTADRQTLGMEAHNKEWILPISGSVCASLSFLGHSHLAMSDIESEKVRPFPQLSAIAVYKTLKKVIGSEERLKIEWPGDVILDGKRVSCSIVDIRPSKSSSDWNIYTLGVGINIQLTAEDLAKIDQPVTSLNVATGGKVFDEKEILAQYVNNLLAFIL